MPTSTMPTRSPAEWAVRRRLPFLPFDAAGLPENRQQPQASEPANVEAPWKQFTHGRQFTPKLWNDAYLAAFALSGNLELVTFDKAFRQYPNVACTILR